MTNEKYNYLKMGINKWSRYYVLILFALNSFFASAQTAPIDFQNPILTGFSPDPSICRVGDDYYLTNSSFVWFPAIPIYHSKDLVNWKIVGHGVSRPGLLNFNGLKDRSGIWAVTIRHHDGLFYLITTSAEGGGGNFYVTAKKAEGPWSDPVWLKDAPGVDPSLFWDDDGKCYYIGNTWDIKREWPGQCAVWIQELNLEQKKLVGERKQVTYGYANNAGFAEGPHLYKINGKYLLLNSEGGTDQFHAIVSHHSNSVFGPYISDKVNPVLSHRQLGKDYPIQAVGHGDLVQTQKGEWWAPVLGRRIVDGHAPLSRETFLTKIKFEDGTPIFNPGFGKVLLKQKRPDLPWSPFAPEHKRDEFDGDALSLKWHFVRIPEKKIFEVRAGKLYLKLQPNVADSLVSSALIIQKTKYLHFSATTKLSFTTTKDNEQAGLIIYRNSESYFMLMKKKRAIALIKKQKGKKELIATIPYSKTDVYLSMRGNGLKVDFSFGETEKNMNIIGNTQSLSAITENAINRFNGPGIGLYASSNGQTTSKQAFFDWFEHKEVK